MKILFVLLWSGALPCAAAAEGIVSQSAAVLPMGALPAHSKVSLERVNDSKTYFTQNPSNASSAFEELPSQSLFKVKSFSSPESSTADTADLQALVQSQSLMIQKSALTASSALCDGSSQSPQCTLKTEVPVYSSGSFDFLSAFLKMLNPLNWFRALRGADTPATDKDVAQAMTETIERANSLTSANGQSSSKKCDLENKFRGTNLAASFREDKNLHCGVQQALEAYHKNQDQIHGGVLIFNDFSDGGRVGKMWFLYPDGSLAKGAMGKNPIPVSRGKGGFGSGLGSLKTPNGAILTKRYSPPRDGNIKDGIELVGLEEQNKDIHRRGVLLHGWDPMVSTSGCLGVSGKIETRAGGRRTLGPQPPYLDQLKEDVLKDGGVLIYNFTPAKQHLCKMNSSNRI